MEFKPHRYQDHAIKWIMDHPSCGLFLDMGLGKTVITLTAVEKLIRSGEITKVLVVAPLRVAGTVWAEEAQKWEHTSGLRCSKILGSPIKRIEAIRADADVYIINRENVAWLVSYMLSCGYFPFDMLVLDELSSFKSSKSGRFRAIRRCLPRLKRVVGLTGTPAPNGLMDLWSQIYLLDRGERLGRTLGGYRDRYFVEGRRNAQVVFNWVPKPEAAEAIYGKISDICMSMTAEDYLSMPPCSILNTNVRLSAAAAKAYKELQHNLVLPYLGGEITASNAAVLTGKLLQLSNGAIYSDGRNFLEIHSAKLDALEDLIEQANGQPVLVYYAYQHDMERICKRITGAHVMRSMDDVARWNRGEIPVMLCHPDSAGHGLNLQAGGHIIIWYGLTWSLEKYQQANARLFRQGQKLPVTIYRVIAEGTMDEAVIGILDSKEQRQDALLRAVKAVIDDES